MVKINKKIRDFKKKSGICLLDFLIVQKKGMKLWLITNS